MEDHHLQPLIPKTNATTTTSEDDTTTLSTSRIVFRLLLVFFIATFSIWANFEASKGFDVAIKNDAGNGTPSGRRFALLFVSNAKATRIVLNTSEFAEKILYPHHNHPKKPVDRVTVELSRRNLTHPVVVVNHISKKEFVILISPSVMYETDVDKAMVSAVQRGMARVWLWDGEDGAPKSLLDGMVEYVNIVAGFGHLPDFRTGNSLESDDVCWKDKDHMNVAYFLNYCEGLRKGFIGRLNQAMKNPWDSHMVDDALGLPAQQLCASTTTRLSNTSSQGS